MPMRSTLSWGCMRALAQRQHSAARIRLVGTALLGVIVALVADAPAAAATGLTPYPVLIANRGDDLDGPNGTSVTDIGPSWNVTIPVQTDPSGIAVTPDGKYAYVTNYLSGTVSVIEGANTATPSVLTTLTVGGHPDGIAITPDGNYAYLTNDGTANGTVDVIDGADTGTPSVSSTTLTVGQQPKALAITPDGKYAYVTNSYANTVSVIDGVDTATPSVASTPLSVGAYPDGIAITPDGDYAYVTDLDTGSAVTGGTVDVIDDADSSSPSVSPTTLTVGGDPWGIAITPDGKYAYVGDYYYTTNNVSVIDDADSSSPTVSATSLNTGTSSDYNSPAAVAISPDGRYAYVTDYGVADGNGQGTTVTVIQGTDSASPSVASSALTVGEGPYAVAVVPTIATSTVPGAPTSPTAVPGNASITVGWTDPTSNGGTPIIGYDIYCSTTSPPSTTGSPTSSVAGASASSGDVTGLTNGSLYHCIVTAVNDNGQSAPSPVVSATPTAQSGAVPVDITLPTLAGTVRAGQKLTCSRGSWTNSPTNYAYQWTADGTPIQGATSSTYTVQTQDEQLTLMCVVTASNGGGSGAPAKSRGITVPVPNVKGCPAATGRLSGVTLGLAKLGMTRTQARRAYTHSSTRGYKYEDFFCLTPIGVRVGYASPKLLKRLPGEAGKQLQGRVIWASTSSGYYSLDGIRPGATVAAARNRLKLAGPFHVGLNYWYLAPFGSSTAVLKVRVGIVEEIGIGNKQLTVGRDAELNFLNSFS